MKKMGKIIICGIYISKKTCEHEKKNNPRFATSFPGLLAFPISQRQEALGTRLPRFALSLNKLS